MFNKTSEFYLCLLAVYISPVQSSTTRVVLREGLVPENLSSLAKIIIVADCLALLICAFLSAISKLPVFFIASRRKHTLHKHFLILVAGRLVLEFIRPQFFVDGLENAFDEAEERVPVSHIINYCRNPDAKFA